jgi:flagellar basal body rod protein FlgG
MRPLFFHPDPRYLAPSTSKEGALMKSHGWRLIPVSLALLCFGCGRGDPGIMCVHQDKDDLVEQLIAADADATRQRQDEQFDKLIQQTLQSQYPQRLAELAVADDPAIQPILSALDAVQRAQDAAVENLANVETTAYKAVRPLFVGGKDKLHLQFNFEQGPLENTNRPLDVAIQGNGFFRIKVLDSVGDGYGYTRLGNFFINRENQIVIGMGDGYRLDPTITIPSNADSISISQTGLIEYLSPGSTTKQIAGQMKLYTFTNPDGLKRIGSLYQQTPNSGDSIENDPGHQANGILLQGYLEGSNVDPLREKIRLLRLSSWRSSLLTALSSLSCNRPPSRQESQR